MKIFLACGGTGGHIFPGVALAECFEEKIPGAELVFVGTNRGLEKEVIAKTHWRLEMLEAPSMADKKGFGKMVAVFHLLKAIKAASRLLSRERPNLVLGTGGYASVPVLLAAVLRRIPAVTLETNAIPGLANRLLKYFAKYFFLSPLGAPVRKNLFAAPQVNPSGKKVVLVFGGSQGAKKINGLLLAALPELKGMENRIHFIHQVGRLEDAGAVAKKYQAHGFSCDVLPFIDAMGQAYARADFVIARSGANTVAELSTLRKPSLLIPFPFSAAAHQEANAKVLEEKGGAKVLKEEEASGRAIADILKNVLSSPDLLEAMRKNLENVAAPRAAEKIVKDCMGLLEQYV